MEKQFKVGDKVRVIGRSTICMNNLGDVGIIKEYEYGHYRVKVNGNKNYCNWHLSHQLELIEVKENKVLKLLKTYIKLLLFRYYINDQYGKPEKQTLSSICAWFLTIAMAIDIYFAIKVL